LSTQVLQEFYWAVTRKLASPLPAEVAEERVRDFSRLPLVRAGAGRLLTEDLQHGQRIGGLTVENPFLEDGED
jgi:predicted nucleic acid-binding protein